MKAIVSDAGPILSFARAGQLDILAQIVEGIWIPHAVHEEIVIHGHGRPGSEPQRPADSKQRDFFIVATATFQLTYVFLIMEIGTRRLLHFNVTRHPTAGWTLQQFRECVTGDEGYRFVIHDRDSIYSKELDTSLKALGLTVLKTPYKSPPGKFLLRTTDRNCSS